MALGPGKYDDLCTYVLQRSEGNAAIVLVLNGRYGSGFSAQISDPIDTLIMPKLLRHIADEIEKDTLGQ